MLRNIPCFAGSGVVEQQPAQPTHDSSSSSDEQQRPAGTPDAQHETTPVEAWRNGQLTLGFSGGGFLLPYHLGVFRTLAAGGIVSVDSTMAGSSAGALVSNCR
jgi:predicted acylesterase/phospholipase RssA